MVLVTVYRDDVEATTISAQRTQHPDRRLAARHHRLRAPGSDSKVMLKPQLDLLNDPSHWRGQIGPDFTDADWTAWFSSYDEQIVHYAQLAADAHCEQFSVGCELDSTVGHEAAWRQVVADVRAVYPGKITYADDQITTDPQAVAWWDAVDLIGQDAYPTLEHPSAPHGRPALGRLGALLRPLLRLSRRFDKPVIFTEIGVRSIAGAARAPWDWQVSGKIDLTGQKRWYQAALTDLRGPRLDEGPVLVAVVHGSHGRRSQGRQLHAAR